MDRPEGKLEQPESHSTVGACELFQSRIPSCVGQKLRAYSIEHIYLWIAAGKALRHQAVCRDTVSSVPAEVENIPEVAGTARNLHVFSIAGCGTAKCSKGM